MLLRKELAHFVRDLMPLWIVKSSLSHQNGWRLCGSRTCVLTASPIIKFHNATQNTDAANVTGSTTPACAPTRVRIALLATILTTPTTPPQALTTILQQLLL